MKSLQERERTKIEQEIYNKIKLSIKKHWDDRDDSVGKWTRVIKETLNDLGRKKGYKVYSSLTSFGDDYTEWMYDLCWVREGKTWRDFYSLHLICEIEWDTTKDRILEDFQKLVVGISKYCLFIFTHRDKKITEGVVNRCKDACRMSKPPRFEKKYMLIGIPNQNYRDVPCFTWAV